MNTLKISNRKWPAIHAAIFATAVFAQVVVNSPAALALGATGDGLFTVSSSVTSPEVPDTETIDAHFSGTDSLGLPTFPNGTTPTTCTATSTAGIAVLLVNAMLLPCGATTADSGNGTGKADRVIIDGYVLIPDEATGISLQMSNDHPDASILYVGSNHLYSSPSDERTALEYKASINTPFQSVGSISSTVATLSASSVCANSPSVAFRAYVYDASASHAFILKWRVTGGPNDTGGAYQAIPSSFFSSLTGYDNDLDNNGTPDYQEADTDGDSIPDWQEMGQIIEGDALDTDTDGTPDCSDTDSDNDGSTDGVDPNRLSPNASPDTIDAVQQAIINTNLATNDIEFAGPTNSITDLGTGSASGHALATSGQLTWDTSGAATGAHTIDYRICNDGVTPPVCATATATINLTVEADLETAVSYPSSSVAPGQETAFTVMLTNNGASNAVGALVDIALPANMVLGTTSLPAACTELTTTTMRCTHAGTASQTESYVIPVLISAGAAPSSPLTGGSATATSSTPDPVPANNTVALQLDTAAAITDFTAPQAGTPPASLSPNDVHTLQITTTNNGPSHAASAPQTAFTLPNGLALDLTAPNPSNCAVTTAGPPQTITCTPAATPTIGADITTSLPVQVGATTVCLTDVTATVEHVATDPTAPGSILISLPLAAADSDADTISNNTEIGPDCSSPLDTDGDSTPDYQDTDSDNDGSADGVDANRLTPTAATDTIAAAEQDTINFDVTTNDIEFAGPNNTVTDLGTGTASGHALSTAGQLTWDTTGAATGAHTVDYRICNDAVAPSVCATTTATITLTAGPQADLAVSASAPATPTTPGTNATIAMTLANNGTHDTSNAAVTVTAPIDTTFVTASLPDSCAELTATTVRCTHSGTVGDTTTHNLVVHINPSAAANTTLTGGQAVFGGDTPDPATANNIAAIEIAVGPAVTNFSIPQATPTAAPLSPGDTHTLQLTTTNNGPSTAATIPTTIVELPLGIAFDPTASNPSNCAISVAGPPQIITCTTAGTPPPGTAAQTLIPLKIEPTVVCVNDITIGIEQVATDPVAPGSITASLPLVSADSDADTISDSIEIGPDCSSPLDTDGDSTPDYLDTDSDNDNILDRDEVGPTGDVDSDGDGTPDRLDPLGATITGNVFFDQNIDGEQQSNESDISGVVVQLVSAGPDATFGTSDDAVVAADTTQSPYRFVNIADGDYLIRLDTSTLPYAVYATGTAAANVTVSNATTSFETEPSFGEFYASVSGTLTDADNNPVANAVVTITDTDGNTHTTTTDGDGNYILQGAEDSPIVQGPATIATVINGVPEQRSITVAGAQRSIESIESVARSVDLPVTGASRTASLIQAGGLALLLGTFLRRAKRAI